MLFDAVVIGAGPAGSIIGQRIACAGFDVIIFEKTHYPGMNKACGGAISKKCFLDLNLSNQIIERECSRVVADFSGETFELKNKHDFVLFNREVFDGELAKIAKDSGANLLPSMKITNINRCNDGFIADFKNLLNGKLGNVRTKLIIFADGTNTLGYKIFGLGFNCKPENTAIAVSSDLKWTGNNLDSLNFFFSDGISPFGYGWIFPKKDLVNAGVVCLQSKMKQSIWKYFDYFLISQKLQSLEILNSGSRLMPQSFANRIADDSILVIGDAAGTADPVDGGGIHNAIISAEVASKIAIESLKTGNSTKNFMNKYSDLWKKTANYQFSKRSSIFQNLALKMNVNIGEIIKNSLYFKKTPKK